MIIDLQELLESDFNEIEADMSYTGDEIGGLQLVTAMSEEWMTIKESYFVSSAKVARAMSLQESAAEIEMLSEASFKDFKAKVVKFFQDIWARLKGMWKNFIIGVNTAVARDGKRFAAVMAQKTGALGQDFEWKSYAFNMEQMAKVPRDFIKSQSRDMEWQNWESATKEKVDSLKVNELIDADCSKVISGSTASTIANKFKELVMGESADNKGISDAEIREMLTYCEGKDQAIKIMKANQELAEKDIADTIKDINAVKVGEGDNKAAQEKFISSAIAYNKSRKAVIIRIHSMSMSLYKAKFNQCKRVLTSVAMTKNRPIKEATMFLESITDEEFGFEMA